MKCTDLPGSPVTTITLTALRGVSRPLGFLAAGAAAVEELGDGTAEKRESIRRLRVVRVVWCVCVCTRMP